MQNILVYPLFHCLLSRAATCTFILTENCKKQSTKTEQNKNRVLNIVLIFGFRRALWHYVKPKWSGFIKMIACHSHFSGNFLHVGWPQSPWCFLASRPKVTFGHSEYCCGRWQLLVCLFVRMFALLYCKFLPLKIPLINLTYGCDVIARAWFARFPTKKL